MAIIKNVMVGSDPELFIVNSKTGKVVSSIGIIPGEKGNAYRSPDMPEGYGLQIDNILAEFNIPPTNNIDDFVKSMNYMKEYIRNYVKKINPDLDIMHASSAIVDDDQLQSDEAKLFGCSVDYNAYTERANPKPEGEKTNLRSSGIHIHISYDKPNSATSVELVKYLDMYLGIPSVVMDPDVERRKLYGKAGCFRLCKYGLEYRSLGGHFLNNDDLIKFMYNGTMKAINAYNNCLPLINEDVVEYVINENRISEARNLIKKYNLI